MYPGSEWVVEFAVRDWRAREQSTWARAEQEEVPDPARGAQSFMQQPLRSIRHLLLVVGTLLSREARDLPRVETAVEEWGSRSWPVTRSVT